MATTPYPFVASTVLTALQLNSTFNIPTTTLTASHTLTAANAGTRVYMNSASATTITVNTSIFSASDVVEIVNIGAGVCTITAGTCTVSTTGTLALVQNAGGRLVFTSASVSVFQATGIAATSKVVQVVNTQTGAVATGTALIPPDNTIPQITEGTEFMTLAITPTSASNILYISAVANVSNSAQNYMTMALFQDATANALAAGMVYQSTAAAMVQNELLHKMTAGTTSSTTFRIRIGAESAGTNTFNGGGGARLMGGVMASSITITEVTP